MGQRWGSCVVIAVEASVNPAGTVASPCFCTTWRKLPRYFITTRNLAGIAWNQELLEQCLIAYGIKDPPHPPETCSQPSQSSQSLQEEAEKAQENHGGDESVETNESVERQNVGHGSAYQSEDEALKGAEVF